MSLKRLSTLCRFHVCLCSYIFVHARARACVCVHVRIRACVRACVRLFKHLCHGVNAFISFLYLFQYFSQNGGFFLVDRDGAVRFSHVER